MTPVILQTPIPYLAFLASPASSFVDYFPIRVPVVIMASVEEMRAEMVDWS